MRTRRYRSEETSGQCCRACRRHSEDPIRSRGAGGGRRDRLGSMLTAPREVWAHSLAPSDLALGCDLRWMRRTCSCCFPDPLTLVRPRAPCAARAQFSRGRPRTACLGCTDASE
eukprot:503379-Hanusia_phi.AAC.2